MSLNFRTLFQLQMKDTRGFEMENGIISATKTENLFLSVTKIPEKRLGLWAKKVLLCRMDSDHNTMLQMIQLSLKFELKVFKQEMLKMKTFLFLHHTFRQNIQKIILSSHSKTITTKLSKLKKLHTLAMSRHRLLRTSQEKSLKVGTL